MAAKKKLHPTMQANADRLKRGEPLHGGGKPKTPPTPQRPKIRSKARKV